MSDSQATPVVEVGHKGRARVPTPKISRQAEEGKEADEYMKNLPTQYQLRRFYLPSEVAVHNTSDNIWVSFFN